MHHRLYHHLVWTTYDREPSIDAPTAQFLSRYLQGVADRFGAEIIESGFVSTHVHLLVRIPSTASMAALLQAFKGGSAAIANRQIRPTRPRQGKLRWGHGYSATSVSEASLDRVRRYVHRQPEHHPDERIPGWPPPASTE
ncbi:MAG: IS200/IS605 family transposase [Gemmatimonadota bacterium]